MNDELMEKRVLGLTEAEFVAMGWTPMYNAFGEFDGAWMDDSINGITEGRHPPKFLINYPKVPNPNLQLRELKELFHAIHPKALSEGKG